MTFPTIETWLAAAFLVLGLYAYLSQEPELLMPEPKPRSRRWREWGARWRRRHAFWGDDNDRDGDEYVRQLRDDAPPEPGPEVYERMLRTRPGVTTVSLPSFEPRPRSALVTEQQPPWALYPAPVPEPEPEPEPEEHVWRPDHRDAPTLVRGMRAIMEQDPQGVRHYVDGLPRYGDD